MKPIQVSITISDPWDVGEAVNWQPVKGHVIQMTDDDHGGRALIKLDRSVAYRGVGCQYLVASPRIQGHRISELRSENLVCCSLIGVSEQQAESNKPLDTANWRGGLAFIGDVEPQARTEDPQTFEH